MIFNSDTNIVSVKWYINDDLYNRSVTLNLNNTNSDTVYPAKKVLLRYGKVYDTLVVMYDVEVFIGSLYPIPIFKEYWTPDTEDYRIEMIKYGGETVFNHLTDLTVVR